MDQASASSAIAEAVVNKRRRDQDQRSRSPGVKTQRKKPRKRKPRRRKNRVDSDAAGQHAEAGAMAAMSGQTEGTRPDDMIEPAEDGEVTAPSETTCPVVSLKETETPVLAQRTQETETDAADTSDNISEDTQDPSEISGSSGNKEVPPETVEDSSEVKPPEENPQQPNVASLPRDKHENPASYANAVSGGAKSQSHASEPRQKMDRSPEMAPPRGSMLRIHMYALLDKKFNFNPEEDTLVIYTGDQGFSVSLDSSCSQKDKSILVQANFSVENHYLTRERSFIYHYSVKRRNKELRESATRGVFIPPNANIQDLHIYEGFIGRSAPANYIRNVIDLFNPFGPGAEELFESWWSAALLLLDAIFQKWNPSDPQSTHRLHTHLLFFLRDLGSAGSRMKYLDDSSPPAMKVTELLSKHLVQILKGELCDKFPRINNLNPLILGFLVFRVTIICQIQLGVVGLAELCGLVSSEDALHPKTLDKFQRFFSVITPNLVLGLINHCISAAVTETVLLLPLLFTVRQADAHAAVLGPFVEEENWSGLEGVCFGKFRELVRHQPDKRSRLLRLIQRLVSDGKEPQQLLLISCSALVPLQDLPQFSKLTGIQVEHLIQVLMYRLQRCRDEPNFQQVQENLKVTEEIVAVVFQKLDDGQDCHMCRLEVLHL